MGDRLDPSVEAKIKGLLLIRIHFQLNRWVETVVLVLFCPKVVPVGVFCAQVSVQAEMASRRWQRSPSGWVEVDVECWLRLASASISPPMAPSRSTEGRLICLAWTLRAGTGDRLPTYSKPK